MSERSSSGDAVGRHHEAACALIPNGGSRAHHFDPPIYLDRAEGARVFDLDGRALLDCNLCFGSMILGHAPPSVADAIVTQARLGTAVGAPSRHELALAEEIAGRVRSIEQVTFVNSGTEATMAAIRIARSVTQRPLVAKFEGGWHGWGDHLLFSFLDPGGPVVQPETRPWGGGLTDPQGSRVVTLPYNHPAALTILDAVAEDLAAVIVEPLQGAAGGIPGHEAWLRELRDWARAAGAVFVCDEVITGFRVGPGGMGEGLGLDPDMVTFGKIAGGGVPIGVLGGKRDLMSGTRRPDGVAAPSLYGTFSGNPLAMVAGLAQLRGLGDEQYAQLGAHGEAVRAGLEEVVADLGVQLAVTGAESLWGLHFVPGVVASIRDVARPEAKRLATELGRYLREEGLLVHSPVHLGFVSTAHTDADVEEIVAAHRRSLERMLADGVLAPAPATARA